MKVLSSAVLNVGKISLVYLSMSEVPSFSGKSVRPGRTQLLSIDDGLNKFGVFSFNVLSGLIDYDYAKIVAMIEVLGLHPHRL